MVMELKNEAERDGTKDSRADCGSGKPGEDSLGKPRATRPWAGSHQPPSARRERQRGRRAFRACARRGTKRASGGPGARGVSASVVECNLTSTSGALDAPRTDVTSSSWF